VVKVTYIAHDGSEHTVEAEPGISAMEAAVQNLIEGIEAECGGSCSCATCMVYVPDEWMGMLPPKSDDEQAMLEMSENLRESSRLSCQITLGDELDGLVLYMPEEQG